MITPLRSALGYSTTPEQNVVITSTAFFLIFCGWSGTSLYATTFDEHIGANCLAILYATFTFSSLISVPIIQKFSPKIVMLFSSSSYAIYICCNLLFNSYNFILYMSAFLMGIGAACLWVAKSVFITQCSNAYEHSSQMTLNSQLGRFNGVFFMIYSASKTVGGLIGAIVFQFGQSVQFMYFVFAIVCISGCFTFLFIQLLNNTFHWYFFCFLFFF